MDLNALYDDLLKDAEAALPVQVIMEGPGVTRKRMGINGARIAALQGKIGGFLLKGDLQFTDLMVLHSRADAQIGVLKAGMELDRAAFDSRGDSVDPSASHAKATRMQVVSVLKKIIECVPDAVERNLQNSSGDAG